MAKPRARRNFRRNYGYKRYRQVASRNYFKVKAEFYDVIKFPSSNGIAIFASRSGQQIPGNRSILPIPTVYTGYTYANVLSGLFSYYKVLSVAVELIPKYNPANQVDDALQTFIGFRMGNGEALTLSEMKALNQSLLLDARNRQRRYWRVFDTSGEWVNTNDALTGAFSLQSSDTSTTSNQHQWDLKISLYLLYKYSKA